MAAPMSAVARGRLLGLIGLWKYQRAWYTEPVGKETHFGFQSVSSEEKGEKVYKVFENIAQKYDVMNDSMSFGVHRLWKDRLLQIMKPTLGMQLLDVAGGTGDIAFRFIDYIRAQREKLIHKELKSQQDLPWSEIANIYQKEDLKSLMGSQAVICDINKEMLRVGQEKLFKLGYSEGISWVMGDVKNSFGDDKFDVYTIALEFGNVTHMERALQEALPCTKPGGRFLCLEFSQGEQPLPLSKLYDLYSFQVIPVLGEVVAGDWKSYQYLVESIRCFPPQEEFKAMIEDAGFSKVNYYNLTSGVVAVHSGFKL
ncbi:hypothetical protein GDO86_001849 [Hymenochirus boettgeri]|uniref:2-methoxy-6-polyprenyl-1,4-benzoquinol methylase, mitochondrial n=1 Tax=Hymenochirus boettgeri TaxID=247094 RepID=A0A8T2KN50_9PIPI|nr:hypothetical protein GDO86_001849 [Hymenochirus boettgeri]